ncbi:uncharacterized protein A1O5_09947 [Cladophialophora psammophila CBS 110553]|uniref:Uncharacterized protein n=1 Tax=Cladophialophora psammophila CBS 110553 TaxID=1182543 RepID=W9WF63_9EURO|nr:uncharacterized protein A1O5_09947 [Cladophialophora psammophila CBS 110553]EXJ66752.1 hypothetical protein A1O5_09947 [Cladophialophora psammophila CBS 110553]
MAQTAKDEYHIGLICALRVEMVAATAMLDRDYGIIKGERRDQNTYHAGIIHDHNVVIAGLPAGIDGLVAAANVAKDVIRTFHYLDFILLVGIGGGVPHLEKGIDIRLGDVVVSQPSGTSGGVVQYEKGKAKHGGAFELKGALNAPPNILLTAITSLQAQHHANRSRPMLAYLADMIHHYPMYGPPGEQKDRLFESRYPHPEGQNNCDQCLSVHEIPRQSRQTTDPQIHYGIIASGNEVVKDPVLRDNLRASYGALCVEMEAAGLANSLPFLVVRGICDYADSHKNDEWHPYAAATAAAWTKELLLQVTPEQLRRQQLMQAIPDSVGSEVQWLRERAQGRETNPQDAEYQSCHRVFKLGSYEEQKNVNPSRVPDTCLWISADPGCGKSTLSKFLVDHELQTTTERTCCYFFFKDNENQNNLASAFCALLHQLFTSQPRLLAHAIPAWRRNGDKLAKEVVELWRIFLAATTEDNSRNVFCVLDGLDECRDADRHRLIEKLAVFLAGTRTSRCRTHSLKIVVTSRPYDSIQLDFQRSMKAAAPSVPIIRLRGEDENKAIRSEINSVIRARVVEMTETLPLSLEVSKLLEQKLLNMQNRTYLWLSLAIDGIYETLRDNFHHDEDSIKTSIAALPRSVEDAYEKILNRVRDHQRDIVRTILHIVVGARRPLNVGEMSIALRIATSKEMDSLKPTLIEKIRLEKYIREWCGLFVFIEKSTIHLVHQTAKEFLIHNQQVECGAWKHSLMPTDTARILAQICVDALWLFQTKLSDADLLEPADVTKEDTWSLWSLWSFLKYAGACWYGHLQDAKPNELVPFPREDGWLLEKRDIGGPLSTWSKPILPPGWHKDSMVERTTDFLALVFPYHFQHAVNLYELLLDRVDDKGRVNMVKRFHDSARRWHKFPVPRRVL